MKDEQKPNNSSEMTSEQARRHLYAVPRAIKVSQVRVSAHKRCKEILDRTAGKSKKEQQGGFAEIMDVLTEAAEELRRLEEGRTDG